MIGDADLLAGIPGIRRAPVPARVRRMAAMLILVVLSLGCALAVRAVVWMDAPVRSSPLAAAAAVPTVPSVVPSEVLAGAVAAPWALLDLGLRAEESGTATVTARFEAPPGSPARPERLLAALAGWSSADLVAVAVLATATGTAVDLRGSVSVDRSPRPGEPVGSEILPLRIAEHVRQAGADPIGVRIVPAEGGREAVALTLVGDAAGAVAAVRALEHGTSAPSRISSLRARTVDGTVTVDLVLTPRLAVRGASLAVATVPPAGGGRP